MQNINKKCKINQFISVCVQLAYQSAKIIENIRITQTKDEQLKAKDDYVTNADLKAQTLIIKGLNKFWPQLKIIGEEDIEYKGNIDFDLNNLQTELFSPSSFYQGKNDLDLNNEFDFDESIVWIDPLDGTKAYIENELQEVTTLIGLSHKNKPLIGIISKPYYLDKENQYIFHPQIYYGHASQNKIFQVQGQQLEEYYTKKLINLIPQDVPINKNRINQQICVNNKYQLTDNIMKQLMILKPQKIIQKYGSGSMLLELLLNNQVNYILNLTKTASRWDICAGEALIMNQDGILLGVNGINYEYKDQQQIKTEFGIFATLNQEYIPTIIPQIKNFQF